MYARAHAGLAVVRTVVNEARDRDVPLFAAGIAYYAFVSVVPLLVLVTVAATTLGGAPFRAGVEAVAGRYLLPAGQGLVGAALDDAAGRGSATVVGTVVLLWGALRLFRGLDAVFSRIYGSAPGGLLEGVGDALLVFGATGGAALGVVGVVAVSANVRSSLARFAVPVVLLAALVVVFIPLYSVFPDAAVSPREALPGAVLAAGGWTVLAAAFGAYAARVATGERAVYGALGAAVLLVTWFYFAGAVVLIGAVVNAVLAGRLDDRQVQQPSVRERQTMSGDREDGQPADTRETPPADLEERIAELRADLEEFEADVRERTVDRASLEADLERYVRRRQRRGHARGWGPYLVLLYGTVMALGAFYFLDGVWAVLAMVVAFLSTLGLYALFVLVGVGLSVLGSSGRLLDAVRGFRR